MSYRSIEEWDTINFPKRKAPQTPEEILEDFQRKIEPDLLELAKLACQVINSKGKATESDIRRIAGDASVYND